MPNKELDGIIIDYASSHPHREWGFPEGVDKEKYREENLNHWKSLAQAILDAGYIKKSDVRVDVEKLRILMEKEWLMVAELTLLSRKFFTELAYEISQHIQELIRGKG